MMELRERRRVRRDNWLAFPAPGFVTRTESCILGFLISQKVSRRCRKLLWNSPQSGWLLFPHTSVSLSLSLSVLATLSTCEVFVFHSFPFCFFIPSFVLSDSPNYFCQRGVVAKTTKQACLDDFPHFCGASEICSNRTFVSRFYIITRELNS